MLKDICAELLVLCVGFNLTADTVSYCADASGYWDFSENAKSNWDCGKIPTISDDVVLDYKNKCRKIEDGNTFDILIGNDCGISVKSITIRNFFNEDKKSVCGILRATGTSQKIDISGDINREMGAHEGRFVIGAFNVARKSALGKLSINVGGNVNVGTETMKSTYNGGLAFGGLTSVEICGDVNVYGSGELFLSDCDYGAGNFKFPSFFAVGKLNMIPVDVYYPIIILNKSSAKMQNGEGSLVASFRIGGLTGNGMIKNDVKNFVAISTLIIDNPVGDISVFSGRIQDDSVTGGKSRVRLIKKGAGIQYLRKQMGEIRFTGGVEVEEGILFMNSVRSVGDLILRGGEIGASDWEIGSAGVLTVDNFNFQSGSIVCIFGDNKVASLINIKKQFVVSENLHLEFVLKTYVLSSRYKLLAWQKKPNLDIAKITTNDLGDIRALFEIADDGLYVTFAQK